MMDSIKEKYGLSRKALLSTIWIFVLINMIYADIIGMLKPGYLEFLDKMSKELSSEMVLTFSILMEIPIIMILLSRILNYRINRIANFIAVPISILFVVYGGMNSPPISYIFFASVEIISMLVIVWFAWKWPKQAEI